MAGIKFGDLSSMTPEQLIQASSKQSTYKDKSGRTHLVLDFSDDDIPEDVLNDFDNMLEELEDENE